MTKLLESPHAKQKVFEVRIHVKTPQMFVFSFSCLWPMSNHISWYQAKFDYEHWICFSVLKIKKISETCWDSPLPLGLFFLRNFHLRLNFCCAKKKAQRFGIAMVDIIVERKYRNIFFKHALNLNEIILFFIVKVPFLVDLISFSSARLQIGNMFL